MGTADWFDIALAIVDGEVVASSRDGYMGLLDDVVGHTGALTAIPAPGWEEEVPDGEALSRWCDVHSGIVRGVCDFRDAGGRSVEWGVLTSTFYRFELEPWERDAVEAWCGMHGVEMQDIG